MVKVGGLVFFGNFELVEGDFGLLNFFVGVLVEDDFFCFCFDDWRGVDVFEGDFDELVDLGELLVFFFVVRLVE